MHTPYDLLILLDKLDQLSNKLVDDLFLTIHDQIMGRLEEIIEEMESQFPGPTSFAYKQRIFSKFMARLVANYVTYLNYEGDKEIDSTKTMNQLMLDVARYLNDDLDRQII